MANPGSQSQGVVSSVQHAVALIEVLANQGSATVLELSRATGLPRATVYRLLRTLEANGITAPEGKRFCLTLRLHEIGVKARSVDRLQLRVQPILDRIVADTGLTAHFAIRDADTAAFVAKRDGPGAMPMASRIGWRGPLHCTAVGKVLLAHTNLPQDLSLPAQSSRTITDHAQLAASLVAVHRDGFALDDEELLPGLRCVAVPWHDGDVLLGAISVSGRREEIEAQTKIDWIVRTIMDAM